MTREPLPGEGEAFTVEVLPDRDAWAARRATGIGGSDAPSLWREEIVRESPDSETFDSSFSLYCRRRGLMPPTETTVEMRVGQVMEPLIVELFAEEHPADRIVYPGPTTILRSLRWPHMTVSLDRAIDRAGALTWGVLEAKHRQWGDWSGGLPLTVQVQIAHALIVTGWAWGVGVGFIQARTVAYPYELDQRFALEHVERCADMWRRIQEGDAPDVDGHPATTRALKALHPNDSGETVGLDQDAADIAAELAAFKADRKAIEREIEARENRLRAAIGPATWGMLPDGSQLQYRTEPRAGHVVGPSAPRVLRHTQPKKAK